MKRITALMIIVLGVILVFSSCAALQKFTKPQANKLTLHFADDTEQTYVLPAEFPELAEDQLEYIPMYYGYIMCIRQWFDEDVYVLFLMGETAEIVGAGMLVDGEMTFWIYEDGKPVQTCTGDELDMYIQEKMYQASQEEKTDI